MTPMAPNILFGAIFLYIKKNIFGVTDIHHLNHAAFIQNKRLT